MRKLSLVLSGTSLLTLFLTGCMTQPQTATTTTPVAPVVATPAAVTPAAATPAAATPVVDPINDPLMRDTDNGGGGGGGGGGGPGGGGSGGWG